MTDVNRDDFDVDHIIPKSCGGGENFSNKALSCKRCNAKKCDTVKFLDSQSKQLANIYHPATQQWSEHFEVKSVSQGLHVIIGKTDTGRATADLLEFEPSKDTQFPLTQKRQLP